MYTSQASLGGLFRHWYKVTDTEHLYKIKTPATLVGQTIKNIDFEENFGIHLVAIERPYEKKEPDRAHTDRIQGYQPYHRGIDDRGG